MSALYGGGLEGLGGGGVEYRNRTTERGSSYTEGVVVHEAPVALFEPAAAVHSTRAGQTVDHAGVCIIATRGKVVFELQSAVAWPS